MGINTVMKTLKEFNESLFNMEKVANLKKFEGAGQATDYFESIQRYLNSKALMDWAKETGSASVRELKTSRTSYDKFVQSMYGAEFSVGDKVKVISKQWHNKEFDGMTGVVTTVNVNGPGYFKVKILQPGLKISHVDNVEVEFTAQEIKKVK